MRETRSKEKQQMNKFEGIEDSSHLLQTQIGPSNLAGNIIGKNFSNLVFDGYYMDEYISFNFINNARDTVVKRAISFDLETHLAPFIMDVHKHVVEFFKDQETNISVFAPSMTVGYIVVTDKEERGLALFTLFSSQRDIAKTPAIKEFRITVTASMTLIDQLLSVFGDHFKSIQQSKILWYMNNDGRTEARTVYIKKVDQVEDEYYPYLPNGINAYIDSYLEHSASILIMAGPPGTGKTSFLRYMLNEYKLQAIMSYEEKILENDRIFVDFLLNDDQDVLIIEDADLFLMDRENAGNKTMSKFLNISDGLIKLKRKKMIFTTNLTNSTHMDQAILRPGRCYDLVNFRELTFTEAQAAAKAGGMVMPEDRREYTLAELFNNKANVQQRRIGF